MRRPRPVVAVPDCAPDQMRRRRASADHATCFSRRFICKDRSVAEDLAIVLGTQETPSLEFKESARNTSGILQAICAFANDLPRHGGGDLLVGVDKDGNAVAV